MDRGEIDDAEAILEPGGSFEAVLLAPAAVFLLPSRLFATRRQRRRLAGRQALIVVGRVRELARTPYDIS